MDMNDSLSPRDLATHRTNSGVPMKRLIKIYLQKPELAGIVLLLALIVLFGLLAPSFLTVDNWRGIFGLLPEIGLVVIGVTILMIAGEFDLSVGSVFALMPMVVSVLLVKGWAFLPSFGCGLLVAALVGMLNGLITLRFSIPSFITTLGMMYATRSLTVVISGGFPPLLPEGLPLWLWTSYIGTGGLFRVSFLWFIGIAALATPMLSHTNFGSWIRATGGFLPAAETRGIHTKTVKLICFILCSVLAGIAGVIQVLRLYSPLPSLGEGLELEALAAAVIGGTALSGGVGTILGGVVGAVLILVIDNGMVVVGVDANWFKFAIGVLTVTAVIFNSRMRQFARRMRIGDES
jgi:simple sugar transport system permease protein